MKKISIADRTVSSLLLGSDYFGATVSPADSFSLMDRFLELGGNAIDTARMYANWIPGCAGKSEETIGQWMKDRGNRDRVFLITKGGAIEKNSTDKARISKAELTSDLEESLRALQTECVDLYFLHRDDEDRPEEEIMDTLHGFIKAGKERSIGASNWRAHRIEAANRYAASVGLPGFAVSEIQWSLALSTPALHKDPTLVCMDETEYHYYLKKQMPVFAFSSQAKGFFIRGIRKGLNANNEKAMARFATEENIARLERVRILMDMRHLTPAQITLGYLTSQPFPTCAIIGCKTVEQLEESMQAADTVLSAEDRSLLSGGKLL